jgi:hypothetical protein
MATTQLSAVMTLAGPPQLAGLVLPDAVQDPDAGIADDQRDRAGGERRQRIPPVQGQARQGEA